MASPLRWSSCLHVFSNCMNSIFQKGKRVHSGYYSIRTFHSTHVNTCLSTLALTIYGTTHPYSVDR